MARTSTQSQLDQRSVLGKIFWGMMGFYGFNRDQQAHLLQKSPNNRAVLSALEKDTSLPEGETAIIVTSQLAGIHKNLSIIYPDTAHELGNRIAKESWFKRKNYLFDKETPMEYLFDRKDEVIRRLFIVRRVLDIERTSA